MAETSDVVNLNFPSEKSDINRNYQLIRNDVIELESDTRITSYSIMINSVCDNEVTESEYLCDVTRDAEQAKMLFELIALGGVPGEILEELAEELL